MGPRPSRGCRQPLDSPRQRIRLCVASPSFFPVYGGVQLRFLRYLPRLTDSGIDARIFSGTPTEREVSDHGDQADWRGYRAGHVFAPQELDGVPAHRVRLPDHKGWRRTILYNQALLRYCRRPESRPDVLQMLNHLRARSIPWLMRLRAMGIPLVYAVTIAPSSRTRKPQKRILWRYRLRRLYDRFDCIITNNPPLRDMVRGLGVRTRIEVIANGIDLQRFRPDAGEGARVRQVLGIAAQDPVICAVGAVIPRKGPDLLLEAWIRLLRRHPDCHLLFVGPQSHLEQAKLADLRGRIQDLIRASGRPGQVHFTGVVDHPESYLQASDLLVLASEREGMPNSVLEAMATSVPVVVTPYAGLSGDIGVAGRHFLLAEPDAEALAGRIQELLEDPQRRAGQAGLARQWVRQTLSLERSIERYAALYRELAGDR